MATGDDGKDDDDGSDDNDGDGDGDRKMGSGVTGYKDNNDGDR